MLVRKGGLEPPPLAGPDPKSGASANSATFASLHCSHQFNNLNSAHLSIGVFGSPVRPKVCPYAGFLRCRMSLLHS